MLNKTREQTKRFETRSKYGWRQRNIERSMGWPNTGVLQIGAGWVRSKWTGRVLCESLVVVRARTKFQSFLKQKLMVSRQTYFPMVTDKVQKYFSEFVNPSNKNKEIWLDFNDTPLKWCVVCGHEWYSIFLNFFVEGTIRSVYFSICTQMMYVMA